MINSIEKHILELFRAYILINIRIYLRQLTNKSVLGILSLLVILFSNCRSDYLSVTKDGIDLSGPEWYMSFQDNPNFSSRDFPHINSNWDKVEQPKNLRILNKKHRGVIWLRRTLEIDEELNRTSRVFHLGRMLGIDEVYINGKLIGKNGYKAEKQNLPDYNYNRERIYSIPANVLEIGENSIAIKIDSKFISAAGIVSGPISISTIQNSENYVINNSLSDISFVAVFLFIGIFFLINFYKMREMKENLAFSFFIISFSFYKLVKNEFVFQVYDNFWLYKYLEYFFLLNIPFLYINFFYTFFSIEKNKYLKYYYLFNFVLCISFIFLKPTLWYDIIGFWSIHLLFILLASLYILRKDFLKNKENILYFIAVLIFAFSLLKEVVIQRGIINVQSSIDISFLVFTFFNTALLRLKFIRLKLTLLKRYDQLNELDNLRVKLFIYMDRIMSTSLQESKKLLKALYETPNEPGQTLKQIYTIFQELHVSMDDIQELSRLETTSELLYIEKINFVDFIKNVIPENQITYSIKVDSEYQIENNLELINSLIIRLIDFSGFKDFENIDLIITNDLKHKIHFRFMLYNKKHQVTYKLYKELSEEKKENIQSIRWSIIKEILRLLGGGIEASLINKKYLRIDLELESIPPEKSDTAKDQKDEVNKYLEKITVIWKDGIQKMLSMRKK